MDNEIFQWISNNLNKWFISPRKNVFNPRRIKEFMITGLEKDSLIIKFKDSKAPNFLLYFWMIERTISHLEKAGERAVPIGAAIRPPYIAQSVEEAIWKFPYPLEKSSYKAASHICDILSLVGWVEFEYVLNPKTGNDLQGVKLRPERLWDPKSITNEKKNFLQQYEKTIKVWTGSNKYSLTRERMNFKIGDKTTKESIESRNRISQRLTLSRIRNQGGVDLETLDIIMKWANQKPFPIRIEKIAVDITREAFYKLDLGDIIGSVEKLMSVTGLNITMTSNIIGLSNQFMYPIYTNKVGKALLSLQFNGERLVKCPPGGDQIGDILSKNEWAKNYAYLIWTLEVITDRMNEDGVSFNIADTEIALTMLGDKT
jgi:hypothetical protein